MSNDSVMGSAAVAASKEEAGRRTREILDEIYFPLAEAEIVPWPTPWTITAPYGSPLTQRVDVRDANGDDVLTTSPLQASIIVKSVNAVAALKLALGE